MDTAEMAEHSQCPCCRGELNLPPLDDLITEHRITGPAERVLRTLWEARGFTVDSQRLFDVIFCDDPSGGPDRQGQLYAALNSSINTICNALASSGVRATRGRKKGWRLQICEPSQEKTEDI